MNVCRLRCGVRSRCRPTLVLVDGAEGFSCRTALKPLIATDNGFNRSTASKWWQDDVDKNMLFYAQIHALRLELGSDNDGAVGILWAVAQQTSIRNVSIDVASGFSGIDVGYPGGYAAPVVRPTPGGGGTVEDVDVRGGAYGIRMSASQWLVRSLTIRDASIAAIAMPHAAWSVTLLDVHIRSCPVGVAMSGALDAVTILDSTFDGSDGMMHAAVTLDDARPLAPLAPPPPPLPLPTLVLSHVSARSVDWIVRGHLHGPTGNESAFVDSWRLAGAVMIDGVTQPDVAGPLPRTRRPPPGGALPRRPRPSFDGDESGPAPVSVWRWGAKGDGLTDDTAALQAAIDGAQALFLPHGVYIVRNTLRLSTHSRLVGEGLAVIRLASDADGFGDESAPKPMVRTSSDAASSTTLAGLTLETGERNYGVSG